MPIVERGDGSTAYLETDELAAGYARDLYPDTEDEGASHIFPDDKNPDDEKTPESVPASSDSADPTAQNGDDSPHV